MSFGPDPNRPSPGQPPQGFEPDFNPFSPTTNTNSMPPDQYGVFTQLTVVGVIIGIMMLFLAFAMVTTALGINAGAQQPANMPPAQRIGFQIGNWGSWIIWSILQTATIIGAIAMVSRKWYPMAIAGAIISMIPICGPCLGLSIPFGIWAIVLLVRHDVRLAFS